MKYLTIILFFLSLSLSGQSKVDTISDFLSLRGVGSPTKNGVIKISSETKHYVYTIDNPYTNQIKVGRLSEGNYTVTVHEGKDEVHRRRIYICRSCSH